MDGPDFDVDLGAELEAGMAEHRAEVEAIAAGPWPPGFADTIEALERAGERLHRAERLLVDRAWSWSTPELRALEAEVMPRLAAHRDAVGQDARIFARIADLSARRDELALDAEAACVLDRYHRDVVRAGAKLGPDEQARLRQINERLSALAAQYRSNLHEETSALAVLVETADELAGLPAPMVDAAARAADAAGQAGYLLKLSLSAVQPAHDHLHDRSLRERLWRAAVSRGRRGGEHDNRATVAELAALRAERAGLLGFSSHAEYMIAEQTADSVETVIELLGTVGAAAAGAARIEAERHTAALHADGYEGALQPWDWPYYAARERRSRHAADEGRLQQYFVFDRVLVDGLFGIAETLYGLRFVARDDLPRPGKDVSVWQVRDDSDTDRGLLYVDPFARDGKSGGAWMDAYAEPAPLLGRKPLVFLTMNVTPPAEGAPALMTPLDVRIAFHEFGHGLHMLLSDVTYPRIAGINVAHDVVEFPSKFHEALAFRPDVLARYARHHVTGHPVPAADVAALNAFIRESAPYISTQGAAQSLLDQAWHGLAPGETVAPEAVDEFERAVVQRYGIEVRAVGFGNHSTFFSHIWDGQYGGTHYAYLWSARLEAVTLQWLDEHGGLTRANGQRLREAFLARGAVVDPIEAITTLTGRRPSVGPLLERRGLAPATPPGP